MNGGRLFNQLEPSLEGLFTELQRRRSYYRMLGKDDVKPFLDEVRDVKSYKA